MRVGRRTGVGWAIVGWIAAAVALAYLVHVVWEQRGDVAHALGAVSWPWMLGAALAFTGMAVIKGAYHALLVSQLEPGSAISRRAVGCAFLVGQLLRYLPGKIWGLVYQANRLQGVCRPSTVVAANGLQMAIGAAVSVTLFGALALAHVGMDVAVVSVLLALLGAALAHRHFAAVSWALHRLLRRDAPVPWTLRATSPVIATAVALVVADWLLFIAGFFALGAGLASFADAVRIAVGYAGASIAAMAAVAVPAGLGVREALFVSTSDLTGQTAGALLALGVLARLTMMAGDAAAALAALLVMGKVGAHE